MVVVAARRNERGLGSEARRQLEAEHAAVELQGAFDVGDLQVGVADVHARGDGVGRAGDIVPLCYTPSATLERGCYYQHLFKGNTHEKKNVKKMNLTRETLKTLDSQSLEAIAAGAGCQESNVICSIQHTCVSCVNTATTAPDRSRRGLPRGAPAFADRHGSCSASP